MHLLLPFRRNSNPEAAVLRRSVCFSPWPYLKAAHCAAVKLDLPRKKRGDNVVEKVTQRERVNGSGQ